MTESHQTAIRAAAAKHNAIRVVAGNCDLWLRDEAHIAEHGESVGHVDLGAAVVDVDAVSLVFEDVRNPAVIDAPEVVIEAEPTPASPEPVN